jgi:hypothetical protein
VSELAEFERVSRNYRVALDATVTRAEATEARLADVTAGRDMWKSNAEAAEARVKELKEALREARPYVFNRVTPNNDEWRSQTATGVLSRVDAALARDEAHAE